MFPASPVMWIEKNADFFSGKNGLRGLGRFKERHIFKSEAMKNIQPCLADVEPDAMLTQFGQCTVEPWTWQTPDTQPDDH